MEFQSKLAKSLSSNFLALVLGLLILAGCSDDEAPKPATAESYPSSLVTDWIDLQLIYAKQSPGFTPPIVARAFGYCGLTFYEAVVPGIASNRSLVGQLTQLAYLPTPMDNQEYHWGLSANAAAAQITRKIFENAPAPLLTRIDSLEDVYETQWSGVPVDIINRSVEFGKVLADSIYGYSKTDGGHKAFNRNFPASYVPPVGPGLWSYTNSQLALLPFWGNNRSFIKDLNTRITTKGFPTYSTDPASVFFAEANEVYTIGKSLTPEQTNIAYYWADEGFVTYTPSGHSMSIFSQLIREGKFTLATAAEGYVKLGLAVSDAFVYCWNVKYTSNLLRPSQYIQPNIDPLWVSLIPNPPFPEYTSGHSTQAGSAARVLTAIFGSDFAFTDLTHTKLSLGLAPRSFSSFYQMAEESGISRIYAGIHFNSANVEGRTSGYAIGLTVLQLNYRK